MMAKWQSPDASAEVERLRVELEQARAELHTMKTAGIIEVASRNNRVTEYMFHWEGRALDAEARADRLQAERDDLAARLASIQQSERKYTAAKLEEAARMRKGQAI